MGARLANGRSETLANWDGPLKGRNKGLQLIPTCRTVLSNPEDRLFCPPWTHRRFCECQLGRFSNHLWHAQRKRKKKKAPRVEYQHTGADVLVYLPILDIVLDRVGMHDKLSPCNNCSLPSVNFE